MPLVVPGLQSKEVDSKTSDWTNKLVGKTLGDSNDETTFAKKDLPENHRVIEPGSAYFADYQGDRLNIYVGEDGTVNKVSYG